MEILPSASGANPPIDLAGFRICQKVRGFAKKPGCSSPSPPPFSPTEKSILLESSTLFCSKNTESLWRGILSPPQILFVEAQDNWRSKKVTLRWVFFYLFYSRIVTFVGEWLKTLLSAHFVWFCQTSRSLNPSTGKPWSTVKPKCCLSLEPGQSN